SAGARRKTLPSSPVAAYRSPSRPRARSQTRAASRVSVGFSARPSRTCPLSEITTRSRRPLPNAEAVSSRHVSSLARAASQGAPSVAPPTSPTTNRRLDAPPPCGLAFIRAPEIGSGQQVLRPRSEDKEQRTKGRTQGCHGFRLRNPCGHGPWTHGLKTTRGT